MAGEEAIYIHPDPDLDLDPDHDPDNDPDHDPDPDPDPDPDRDPDHDPDRDHDHTVLRIDWFIMLTKAFARWATLLFQQHQALILLPKLLFCRWDKVRFP